MFEARRFPLWSTFDSVLVENGTEITGARLTMRSSPVDDSPHIVEISIEVPLGEAKQLPFAYEYIEPADERPAPLLIIVAAPGVSIRQRKPPPAPPLPMTPLPFPPYAPEKVDVAILRVQDASLIPPIGAAIDIAGLLAPELLSDGQGVLEDDEQLNAPNALTVERGPSSMRFRHPASGLELMVSVPDEGGATEAYARFAWQYEAPPRKSFRESPRPTLPGDALTVVPERRAKALLTLVVTPDVTVTLRDPAFFGLRRVSPHPLFRVLRCNRVDEVPEAEAPFDPSRESWEEIQAERLGPVAEGFVISVAVFALMIKVFSLPIIGPLLGIAEFAYGLKTGKGLLGDELRDTPLLELPTGERIQISALPLLGVGAVLPFIGPAVNLARHFGTRAAEATALIEAIKKANLTRAEYKAFADLRRLVRSGKHGVVKQYIEAFQALRKLRTPQSPLGHILNGRGQFRSPKLQREMKRELARTGKRMSAEAWAATTTSRSATALLEAELGRGFRNATRAERFGLTYRLALYSVLRPSHVNAAATRRVLDQLVKMQSRLFFGMGEHFLARLRTLSRVDRADLLRRPEAWMVSRMKGNIAEILSEEHKLLILRDLAKGNPGKKVALYRNVRMRQPTQYAKQYGPSLTNWFEFSDDIIAYEQNGHLHVLATLEVKSGYDGLAEGMQQFLKWEERSLNPGTQIRVGELLSPRGKVTTYAGGKSFRYLPKTTSPGQLKWDPRHTRRLFHAHGASPLGIPESFAAIEGKVIPESLGYSACELEHYVSALFERLERNVP